MQRKKPFLDFSLKQPINQWLCVILLSSWCIWMVSYLKNQASDSLASSIAAVSQSQQATQGALK